MNCIFRSSSCAAWLFAAIAIHWALTPGAVVAEEKPTWERAVSGILNDPRLRAAHEDAKVWLRDQVVTEEDLAAYGLKMEAGWEQKDSRLPVAVLVHGFQSKAENAAGLLHLAREAGYPCGSFAYPNDHLLTASAELLASELRKFTDQYPGRQLVLVCHSMGGVVARACLEDSELDPGNVARLIMIAPPNHGSLLAYAAPGADAWEHIIGRQDGLRWEQIRLAFVDGMGDAAWQLRPGSEFLNELNARPRPPRVDYTIILGTKAVMSAEEMTQIREGVKRSLARLPLIGEHARQLDGVLAEMDEVVHGKGDGAVALSRGRLEGIDDTHELPFDHLSVVGAIDNETTHRVHRLILERLKRMPRRE